VKLVLAYEAMEFCAKAMDSIPDDELVRHSRIWQIDTVYQAAATLHAHWAATVGDPDGIPAPPMIPIPTWLAEIAGYV
jgi:hypothetical protein